MRHMGRRIILGLGASAIVALGLAGSALSGEVKSIAVLVPEQGTDYGWNQQGVDAALPVLHNEIQLRHRVAGVDLHRQGDIGLLD